MNLDQSADHILKDCMGMIPGESVLIITDDNMPNSIPDALFNSAKKAGFKPMIMKMTARSIPGEEPPEEMAKAMLHYDVILAPTSKSLTHTQARMNASKSGARIATLPGITENLMMNGGITANYDEIQKSAVKLSNLLNKVETIRIVSQKGTDITFHVKGEKWQLDTGICNNYADFSNLPAGELFIAPENANGVYIIDGSVGDFGLLESPIQVVVKDRQAISISGENSDELIKMLDSVGDKGRNIAELGIGLNPNSILSGNVLEDEKVKGTIHIAFGDNSTFGGDVQAGIHIDGIVTDVQLFADGKEISLKDFNY